MSWKDWQTMAKSNDAIASSEAFLALQMSAVGSSKPCCIGAGYSCLLHKVAIDATYQARFMRAFY
jgi:hypothetical protein